MPQPYPEERKARFGFGPKQASKQVRMSNMNFLPLLVRIRCGESIELVVETFASHTIVNGTWENGKLRLSKEQGAPVVDVRVERANPQTIGPFNSVGSFKFCSTEQRGMNLTVHVS